MKLQNLQEISDIIMEFKEFKQMKSLLSFHNTSEYSNFVQNKAIFVHNSIGSEFRLFLDNCAENLEFEIIKIDLKEYLDPFDNLNDVLKSKIKSDFIKTLDLLPKNLKEQGSDFQKEEQINEDSDDIKPANSEEKTENNPVKNEDRAVQKPKIIIIDGIWSNSPAHVNLLNYLVDQYKELTAKLQNLKEIQSTLITIIENDNIISREIANRQDLSFYIPYPDKIQRITFFEDLFKKLAIHTVDLPDLIELTDGWNIKDLKRLTLQAITRWKIVNYQEIKENKKENKEDTTSKSDSENINQNGDNAENNDDQETEYSNDEDSKNKNSNDDTKQDELLNGNESGIKKNKLNIKLDYVIPFTIDIFKEIIEERQLSPLNLHPNEYSIKNAQDLKNISLLNAPYHPIPLNQVNNNHSVGRRGEQSTETANIDISLISGSNITEINSFTKSQLYQFAAANTFDALISALEKIDQARKLDELDREILSNYSFILKDAPQKAISKLTNAKSRIDRMRKITD